MIEIRWHGRGGQGAKTAAQLVAQVALEEGRHSQGFPEYGPERMGAPIRGFTRISDEPVRVHCAIERPSVVVVLDETLLATQAVTEATDGRTVFVVNTARDPERMRRRLGQAGRTWCIDATRIALDELGRPIPNTPMIGALVRATGCVSMETVLADVRRKFAAKFGEQVAEGNVRAIRRAYEEVACA